MDTITYSWLESDQVDRIAELDRRERIQISYTCEAGKLKTIAVDWDVQNWSADGSGEHSVAAQIQFCRGHLATGGRLIGALAGGRLVGLGLLTPEIRPALAQLAYLHVSDGYRRHGIARNLTEMICQLAAEMGAERIYVSATPSQSAVGFYLSQGFEPLSQPLPELYALEPEDIHMQKQLSP